MESSLSPELGSIVLKYLSRVMTGYIVTSMVVLRTCLSAFTLSVGKSKDKALEIFSDQVINNFFDSVSRKKMLTIYCLALKMSKNKCSEALIYLKSYLLYSIKIILRVCNSRVVRVVLNFASLILTIYYTF